MTPTQQNAATPPTIPLRTPFQDGQGNLTRTWILYFNALASTISAAAGSSLSAFATITRRAIDYVGAIARQITDKLGETPSILDFGGVSDAITLLDGMTVGSAFSSATAQFSANDIGKLICIAGAGAAGILYTGIIAGASAGNATLVPTPSTDVTGALVVYGTDNTPALQAAANAFADLTGATILIPAGNFLFLSSVALAARKVTVKLRSARLYCAAQMFTGTSAAGTYPPISPSDGCSFAIRGNGRDQSFITFLPTTGNLFGFANMNPLHWSGLTMIAWPGTTTVAVYTFACYSVHLSDFRMLGFYGNWQATGDNNASGLNRGSWLTAAHFELRGVRKFGFWFKHSIEIEIGPGNIDGVTPASITVTTPSGIVIPGQPQPDPAVSCLIFDTDTSGSYPTGVSCLYGNILFTHSAPGSGAFDAPPEFAKVTKCLGDTSGDAPIKLDDTLATPDAVGRVARSLHFSDCWASAGAYAGVPGYYIGGGDDIAIDGGTVRVNYGSGILYKNGANLRVSNSIIHTNNIWDTADGSGITVEATAGNLTVIGGKSTDFAAVNATQRQRWGIYLKAGYLGPFILNGVDLTQNIGAITTVTDGAITTGTSTFHSASSTFVARTHIGKYITIAGAGPSGLSPFVTVITAVLSTTSVTVAGTAGATVAAASTRYGSNPAGIKDLSSAGFKTILGCMFDPGEGMRMDVYGDYARVTCGDGNFYLDFLGDYPNAVSINFDNGSALRWDRSAKLMRLCLGGAAERWRWAPQAANNSMQMQFRPNATGVTDPLLTSLLDTDTATRFTLLHQGTMQWGDGTTNGASLTPSTPAGSMGAGGAWQFGGAWSANGATPQTAAASGGAVVTTAPALASFGYTASQAAAIITAVNNIRAALVANGIMS